MKGFPNYTSLIKSTDNWTSISKINYPEYVLDHFQKSVNSSVIHSLEYSQNLPKIHRRLFKVVLLATKQTLLNMHGESKLKQQQHTKQHLLLHWPHTQQKT